MVRLGCRLCQARFRVCLPTVLLLVRKVWAVGDQSLFSAMFPQLAAGGRRRELGGWVSPKCWLALGCLSLGVGRGSTSCYCYDHDYFVQSCQSTGCVLVWEGLLHLFFSKARHKTVPSLKSPPICPAVCSGHTDAQVETNRTSRGFFPPRGGESSPTSTLDD